MIPFEGRAALTPLRGDLVVVCMQGAEPGLSHQGIALSIWCSQKRGKPKVVLEGPNRSVHLKQQDAGCEQVDLIGSEPCLTPCEGYLHCHHD